jgi:hypothetical protein
MAALSIAMMLIFGAPTFAAMTPALWVVFALGVPGNVKGAIKTAKDIDKIVNSPAFRAWAAANGAVAIKLRPGEITER